MFHIPIFLIRSGVWPFCRAFYLCNTVNQDPTRETKVVFTMLEGTSRDRFSLKDYIEEAVRNNELIDFVLGCLTVRSEFVGH